MPLILWPHDIEIAARTVFGEARGEDITGQKAVAHVLVNRWRTGYRGVTSLAQACLDRKQFSCWNPADPNSDLVQRVTLMDPAFRACTRAVLIALDEADPTSGARHYHTVKAPAGVPWPPEWARGQKPSYATGGHVFYDGVA